jgi:GTP-binding protein EngB required for normal cell division
MSGLLDVQHRLEDIEALLAQSLVSSPFTQYINDLSPTERKVVHDYLERLRSVMLAALDDIGIPLEIKRASLRWVLQVHVMDLHSALAELGPSYLRGYGPMNEISKTQSLQLEQTLTRQVDKLHAYLRQGLGRDLPQRLARLEASADSVGALKVLDRIVTRWGLVEFRPTLDRIVQRLEMPRFEIAVFGRVSSGKSSLLNHLAGMDVLPVGVTPITAVPTRLVRGDQASAVISFAESLPRTIEVAELKQYASEEENRGNHKHVTDIVVQLPATRLQEGIILVDTPGVGSLALSGSAETYAYLPNCDLGVILIDASSALTQEELKLLHLLAEAGTPAQIVLSKADLLSEKDRQRTVQYIRGQIRDDLGLDLPVHPVSTVGADESLLTQWFDQEIAPMFGRHRSMVEVSLRRKIGHLRESACAVLETMLTKRNRSADQSGSTDADKARQFLEDADAAIRQARDRCRCWADDASRLLEILLQDAAQAIVNAPMSSRAGVQVVSVMQKVFSERGKMGLAVLTEVQKTLVSTLEAMQASVSLAEIDVASVKNLDFRGMPSLDHLASEFDGIGRPWFASWFPSLAVWQSRRTLRSTLEKPLREQISIADRQLATWMKACLEQLIADYEDQAEIVRQQVRRVSGGAVKDAPPAADENQLETDLQELRATPDIQARVCAAPS